MTSSAKKYYLRNRARIIARVRAHAKRNRSKISIARRRHYAENRDSIRAAEKRRRSRPEVKERLKAWNAEWRKENRGRIRMASRATALRVRLEVINKYTDGSARCSCCGEDEIAFLCIDHINGNGSKHRREIGRGKIYRWLKSNGFPKGFQVLCHNCNQAKGASGVCPHDKRSGSPKGGC